MLGQSELPGAAWYPDPYGVSTLRWWDGVQWTDAVHPPTGVPSEAVSAPQAQSTNSVERSPQSIPSQPAPELEHTPQPQFSSPQTAVRDATLRPTGAAPDSGSPSSFPYLNQLGAQPQATGSAPVESEVVTVPTAPTTAANDAVDPAGSAVTTGYSTAGGSTGTQPTLPSPVMAAPVSTGAHVTPAPVPLGLRAAAATLDEDTGTGNYEWSRESRAFDTFPGSTAPVSIPPRTAVTSDVVTNTASSWTIVFMPLLAIIGIVAVMLVIASVPGFTTSGFPSELLLASVAVAFYLVTVLFAVADNRRLYSNGVDRPPHWAWSLLTAPIYLVARVVAIKRETGRTTLGQVIVHVLLLAGGVFLALNFTEVVWPYLVALMKGL